MATFKLTHHHGRRRVGLALLLVVLCLDFATCQRPSPVPQFSKEQIETGAAVGKSIEGGQEKEETPPTTTWKAPPELITTHATLLNETTTTVEDEETNVTEDDPGAVHVTGYISTSRASANSEDELQQPEERAMESTSNNHQNNNAMAGGGGRLLYDEHSFHAPPPQCHTYIPDHLAGDDDYRKLWGQWMDGECQFIFKKIKVCSISDAFVGHRKSIIRGR